MKDFWRIMPLLGVLMLCVSCSGKITGQLVQDGSGALQLQAGLEPNMIALVRSLSELAGGQNVTVLNAASINRSLQSQQGIASSGLRNNGQEKLSGVIQISSIGDVLNAGANRFVKYEAAAGGASGKVSFSINRSGAPKLLAQISPEALDYLSVLMAPAATGENLTKAKYLALVESVYGKGLAAEIATSKITVAITMPAAVKSVKGGTSEGREARFEIPLADLLVLEKALDYQITW
jgi:hypothetical protein